MRRFDPETVGRKRTRLSRIINPGKVKVDELSRAIEQCEERVRSCQSSAREKISHTFTSTSVVCLIMPLFAQKSRRSLKPDSRVRILTRWTSGQKGVCHSEDRLGSRGVTKRGITGCLHSGAGLSATPKSLGDDHPMHLFMNFREAPVHKALVSASKVCHEGYRITLDSEPG